MRFSSHTDILTNELRNCYVTMIFSVRMSPDYSGQYAQAKSGTFAGVVFKTVT